MTQGFGGQPAAARTVCTVGEHTFDRRRVGLVGIHIVISKVLHQGDRLSTDALVFRYAQEKLLVFSPFLDVGLVLLLDSLIIPHCNVGLVLLLDSLTIPHCTLAQKKTCTVYMLMASRVF